MAVTFDDVAADFQHDGGLLDIYVRGIGVPQWNAVIREVSGRYAWTYSEDGAPCEMPSDVAAILAVRMERSVLFTCLIGSLQANCHFFDAHEIEFDIRPVDVNAGNFAELMQFMRMLATVSAKPAVITPEGSESYVIVQVDPAA